MADPHSTPYFETVKSFADVPITSDGVHTATFLDAADGLVGMFDLLGIGIFTFVQNDIRGNVSGVRQSFATHQKTTLEALVLHEREQAVSGHGTACLVRLIRGLHFTYIALFNTHTNASISLQASFRSAYDAVLKKHHGFVVRSAVSVALLSLPSRPVFYTRICQGGHRGKLDTEMTKWLEGLSIITNRMKVYLEVNGYGRI